MTSLDPSRIHQLAGRRRGTARLLLLHLAAVGGYLETDRATLAELLGITVDGVTKTLQRLALDQLELRVPYSIGRDGRPVYADRGQPLRLQLPDVDRVDTPSRVDSPQGVATRVDSSPAGVAICPTCGGERPGQQGGTSVHPSAKPDLRSSDQAGPARSPTARPLRTGGFRDWDRRRRRERFRCDAHAHLAASDPGGPCTDCRKVREAATEHRPKRDPAPPAGEQRPLWPAAVASSTSPAPAATAGAPEHDCDARCTPYTCPDNRQYGGHIGARSG